MTGGIRWLLELQDVGYLIILLVILMRRIITGMLLLVVAHGVQMVCCNYAQVMALTSQCEVEVQ